MKQKRMQQLNVVLPDKDDFRQWIKEIKQEIILELKKEIGEQRNETRYLTRADMAKKLNISLVSLHNRTVQGLPSLKIGARRLYDPKEVDKYLNSEK